MNAHSLRSKPVKRVSEYAKPSLIRIRITLRNDLFGCALVENNVFEFPKIKVVEEEDPVREFIFENLMPWAEENYIDISSMQFKLNAATIMTCLQGMLLNDI